MQGSESDVQNFVNDTESVGADLSVQTILTCKPTPNVEPSYHFKLPFSSEYNSFADFNSHTKPMWSVINNTTILFGGGDCMPAQGIRDGM